MEPQIYMHKLALQTKETLIVVKTVTLYQKNNEIAR